MVMIQNNKYFRLLRAILTSGMAFVINYGITLFLTPFITETVGIEAYGFVSLAKQMTQYAAIAMTAVNAYSTRFITLEYHQNNLKKAESYFSTVFLGNIALGGLILTAAIMLISFLDYLLAVPAEILLDVKLLFLFSFAGFFISNLCVSFSSAAYIADRLDVMGIIRGLSYVAEGIALICLFLFFQTRVYYVGFSLLCAALVISGGNAWVWRKYVPALKISIGSFSWDALKKLVAAGIWNSINSLGDMLNSGLDLLVCNTMLSSLAMGQVAIAKTIYSIFSSLFYLINQAFQPMFLKSYAEKDYSRLLRELSIASKVSGLVANIGFAGFIALGKLYYCLWIPNQDISAVYNLTVICSITAIEVCSVQPLYYIYTLTVKNKLPCLVTILGGLMNVIGMFFLIRYTSLGAYAVVWTTVAVMGIIDFLFNPLYMAHVLQVSKLSFYPSIIRNLVSCALMIPAFMLVSAWLQPHSWISFFICALIDAVLGLMLHFAVAFRISEIRSVLNPIKQKISF